MNIETLQCRLEEALQSGDIIGETEELVEELKSIDLGLDAVSCILKFMQEHPKVDFGAPGPLTHFVERFYKNGYEAALLCSIQQQPTSHTVWMLNRVVNGTKDAAERAVLIGGLMSAVVSTLADEATVKAAKHFLSLHR